MLDCESGEIGSEPICHPLELMNTKGKYTYRKRALEAYPHECNICGIQLPTALMEVDHIDGSHDNCGLDNLQILCPTCHARKTRGVFYEVTALYIPEFG